MNEQDKNKFSEIMHLVAEYYGKTMTKPLLRFYWEGLKNYDLSAVERAIWMHTQNPDSGQFMPKIADVVRLTEGGTQDQAMLAWSKVDQAVKRVGTYSDVVFDDPLIHRLVADLGGWIWLGQQTEKEWPFIAKRFEAAYRGYRARGEVPDYPAVLTGIANLENGKEGQKLELPVLVGDKQQAERVMLKGKHHSGGFVKIGKLDTLQINP